jgi:hypothetical protein
VKTKEHSESPPRFESVTSRIDVRSVTPQATLRLQTLGIYINLGFFFDDSKFILHLLSQNPRQIFQPCFLHILSNTIHTMLAYISNYTVYYVMYFM